MQLLIKVSNAVITNCIKKKINLVKNEFKVIAKVRLREFSLQKEAFNGLGLKGRDACAGTVFDLGLERSVSI